MAASLNLSSNTSANRLVKFAGNPGNLHEKPRRLVTVGTPFHSRVDKALQPVEIQLDRHHVKWASGCDPKCRYQYHCQCEPENPQRKALWCLDDIHAEDAADTGCWDVCECKSGETGDRAGLLYGFPALLDLPLGQLDLELAELLVSENLDGMIEFVQHRNPAFCNLQTLIYSMPADSANTGWKLLEHWFAAFEESLC